MKVFPEAAVRRFRRRFGLFLFGLVATCITTGVLWAQSAGTDIFRIEEDWQLIVGDPDVLNNGPQVTCMITPADIDSAYCAFDINYRTQPDYRPGGMQLHTWDPTDPIAAATLSNTQSMASSGETVTWTQRMSWKNNGVTFKIVDGHSQTWGDFGGSGENGNGQFALGLQTSLPNLNTYSADVSVENSGVSFASNLVNSLTLVAVRAYDANGDLIYETTQPRAVYPKN